MRFKAEVNVDGREVARQHVHKLNLEKLLKVREAVSLAMHLLRPKLYNRS